MSLKDKWNARNEQAAAVRAAEERAAAERAAALAEQRSARLAWLRQSGEMREYEVVELQGTAFTGSAPTRRLRSLLNAKAREGWRVWQVLDTNLGGPVRQGVSGLVVVFERPVPPDATPGELVEADESKV